MNNYKFETLQIHVGQEKPDPATDARAVPIYATTSYVFHDSAHAAARFGLADAGNIYGRLTNPTQGVFEDRIAALEGGAAGLALASGAAAITYTIQALAKKGEHIVAQKTIYGGTSNLLAHTLPLYGVETTFVNIHDLSEVAGAIQPNTKAIYIETLGNPNSDIPDIDAIAQIAHSHGLPLVIDTLSDPANRTWRGYRRPLRYQVHWRTRRCFGRCNCRRRHLRLGNVGPVSMAVRAKSQLSWR